MNGFVRIALVAVLLTAAIALFGCSRTVILKDGSKGSSGKTTAVTKDKPGPPPHAPAHGYRHKNPHGVTLVYDSGLAVYVVSGYKQVYFHKDYYYRVHKHKWQFSRNIKGPWHKSMDRKVPKKLWQNVALHEDDKDKGKGKGKGKGNDKK